MALTTAIIGTAIAAAGTTTSIVSSSNAADQQDQIIKQQKNAQDAAVQKQRDQKSLNDANALKDLDIAKAAASTPRAGRAGTLMTGSSAASVPANQATGLKTILGA